jgi:cell division protein FtsQ
MQPVKSAPLRHDPAPSRAAYRMHRLWLTPLFRTMLRLGLPVFVVFFVAGVYVADEAHRNQINGIWQRALQTVANRPEFQVNLMTITGASPILAEAVRSRLDLRFPVSSFDIDMDAIAAEIEKIPAVAGAVLRVRSGNVLQVTITERVPVVIWRTQTELSLLDIEGRRVARVFARTDRPDLPLIAGEGANAAVPEALALLAAGGPIQPRLRGMVRMGERRWDIVLDRDQRILLPEGDPVPALERVIALDKAETLLARDVIAVDLRNEDRPVLRLAPDAMNTLRASQGVETGANSL